MNAEFHSWLWVDRWSSWMLFYMLSNRASHCTFSPFVPSYLSSNSKKHIPQKLWSLLILLLSFVFLFSLFLSFSFSLCVSCTHKTKKVIYTMRIFCLLLLLSASAVTWRTQFRESSCQYPPFATVTLIGFTRGLCLLAVYW